MKNLIRLLILSILLTPTIVGAQTSQELTNILAGASQDLYISGAAAQSAAGNNIMLSSAGTSSIDLVSGSAISYRAFACTIIGGAGISAGQITFEGSNDNTNWETIITYKENSNFQYTGSIAITASSVGTFLGRAVHRYVRARISTGFTGGTVQAFTRFLTNTPSQYVTQVQQNDVAASISIAANATASGTISSSLPNQSTAMIFLTGTFTATAQVQISGDNGTTWVNVTGSNSVFNVATGAYLASGNMTATGAYAVNIAGANAVRIITTAYTSGTITGQIRVVNSAGIVGITGTPAVTISSGTVTTVSTVTTLSQFAASAAAADATANPTTTIARAANHLYNGSTWDLYRNNTNVTIGTTGAQTASFNMATQTNFNARGAYIYTIVGTVSGTSPTMTAQLQGSYDGGTTWVNIGPASTAITATGNTILFIVYPTNVSQAAGSTPATLTSGATQTVAINAPLPRTWRLAYTIGGTTPSFTFTNTYANYIQ